MPGAFETDASAHDISAIGTGFSSASSRSQQRGCYWISNERTNDGQNNAADTERRQSRSHADESLLGRTGNSD